MSEPTSSDDRAPVPVLLSLGSNVEPHLNLPAAVRALGDLLEIRRASRVFLTDPAGVGQSAMFLNAALAIETHLEPGALKAEVLRPLERMLKRIRTSDRNAPRTIDIDISLFGDLVVDTPEVVLPDPEILVRAHVVVPLADVAPEMRHPVTGQRLSDIARRWQDDPGLRPVADSALSATATELAARIQ